MGHSLGLRLLNMIYREVRHLWTQSGPYPSFLCIHFPYQRLEIFSPLLPLVFTIWVVGFSARGSSFFCMHITKHKDTLVLVGVSIVTFITTASKLL